MKYFGVLVLLLCSSAFASTDPSLCGFGNSEYKNIVVRVRHSNPGMVRRFLNRWKFQASDPTQGVSNDTLNHIRASVIEVAEANSSRNWPIQVLIGEMQIDLHTTKQGAYTAARFEGSVKVNKNLVEIRLVDFKLPSEFSLGNGIFRLVIAYAVENIRHIGSRADLEQLSMIEREQISNLDHDKLIGSAKEVEEKIALANNYITEAQFNIASGKLGNALASLALSHYELLKLKKIED